MDVLDQPTTNNGGKRLETVLAEGYNFNMSDYLSKAFKLFGHDAGSYIGFTVVSFVIGFAMSFIPFLGALAGIIISPALNGGYYIFGRKHATGEQRSFSNFFDGFKNPPWFQLVFGSIVVNIFTAIAASIVVIPAVILFGSGFISEILSLQNNTDPDDVMAIITTVFTGKIILSILLALLIAGLVGVLYIFTPLFIIYRQMGFWEAMEASRKVISKNYFPMLVFLIVLMVLNGLGALFCGVGLLITVPVFFLAVYVAFEDIMGTFSTQE